MEKRLKDMEDRIKKFNVYPVEGTKIIKTKGKEIMTEVCFSNLMKNMIFTICSLNPQYLKLVQHPVTL